jgi:excisionase family DNA binding protein
MGRKSQAETRVAQEPPVFESIEDTAHALGVSGNTVRNLIAQGRLRTVNIGRRKLVVRLSRDAYALLLQGK